MCDEVGERERSRTNGFPGFSSFFEPFENKRCFRIETRQRTRKEYVVCVQNPAIDVLIWGCGMVCEVGRKIVSLQWSARIKKICDGCFAVAEAG